MDESLALKLRVLRAERGWTLNQAAERAGVQPETISDAEHGKRRPYTPTLTKIAKGYGVPVEELLGEAVPLAEVPQETGPSDERTDEEQRPKSVAEVRAKFLPIAAMLEDYCRAYEQLTERAELTDEDVEAFVHTAVEAKDYHLAAIEGELVELGHVLGRKLTQEEQLNDLSVLRPAFARYRALMRALVERLPAGVEKSTLVELTSGA